MLVGLVFLLSCLFFSPILFFFFFSSLITGITNSSGVASVTVSNLSSDTVFTCSYSNVTDTCTVTVPAVLIGTSLTSIQISDIRDIPLVDWIVHLKDENSTALGSKTVKLYIDNVLKSSGTTNGNGLVTLSSNTTFGTHTIKAVFDGDSTYDGCEVSRTATYQDLGGGMID